jgi:hypothetical protein
MLLFECDEHQVVDGRFVVRASDPSRGVLAYPAEISITADSARSALELIAQAALRLFDELAAIGGAAADTKRR